MISRFKECIVANVTATFCPSGKGPGFYQQPLTRNAPSAGGDEDAAAAPGKKIISWIIILLYIFS